MDINELSHFVTMLGEKPYRAKQIFNWLHQKNAEDFSQMSDIPKTLKEKLSEASGIYGCEVYKKYESAKDTTVKYLFRLNNGDFIESVFMEYEHGFSLCVSSQVGCAMGCVFCASGLNGLVRNLTTGEILSQVYAASRDTGKRISSVVIMGSGEPLHNFDNVLKFISLVNSTEGMNLGQRHITLSTCGIVPEIYKLAEKELSINLAVSLHAADDKKRRSLMPVSAAYSLRDLTAAVDYYIKKTNRRVTYEYALIDGINDSEADCRSLAGLVKNKLIHVNLLQVNEIPERSFFKSPRLQAFKESLSKMGAQVTVRRSLGSDVNGACGQLAARLKNSNIVLR